MEEKKQALWPWVVFGIAVASGGPIFPPGLVLAVIVLVIAGVVWWARALPREGGEPPGADTEHALDIDTAAKEIGQDRI